MFGRSPTLWGFLREVYLPLHPGISAGYRVQLETTVRMIDAVVDASNSVSDG